MIRPLNDNVVLKKDKVMKTTSSGIVLSQKEEETEYATVISVGEGSRNDKGELIPVGVKPGEKVIYKSYAPTKVKVDDEEYLIVSKEDILAFIE